MTAREIIINANRGNIANGDFDLNTCLFKKIIPEFLDRVGNVGWSRKTGSITTAVGTRDYDLPGDFYRMLTIAPPDNIGSDLEFYGEDTRKVLKFDAATDNLKPSGYMIIRNDDREMKRIRFDHRADSIYVFPFSYQWELDEKNSGVEVPLDEYVPKRHHWALVSGLRRDIMLDRFDQDDNRYVAERDEFEAAIGRATSTSNREQARRGSYGVFGW
jgi:hypothetical protein